MPGSDVVLFVILMIFFIIVAGIMYVAISKEPQDTETSNKIEPESETPKRIEPRPHPAPEYPAVWILVSYSIGIIGVLIAGYFAFLAPTSTSVDGLEVLNIKDLEIVNLGLLSQAERGTVFGLCIVGLGGIIAVINK